MPSTPVSRNLSYEPTALSPLPTSPPTLLLQDPVRIHEKAQDDYKDDFEDSVIPEACVVDVIRARVVVNSGHTMLNLQNCLSDGFKVVLDGDGPHGGTWYLELIRVKNKVSTQRMRRLPLKHPL